MQMQTFNAGNMQVGAVQKITTTTTTKLFEKASSDYSINNTKYKIVQNTSEAKK